MDTPSAERWRRIERIVHEALDVPAADRGGWLRAQCGDDTALYAEVMDILDGGERPDDFLETPPVHLASLLERLPSPSTPIPPRVGPYRVMGEIGRGGMGTVYLAEREEHFEQRVALKVVGRGLHVDEHLVRRFVEERQLLAKLEHANIARVLDGGVTEHGLPWFAMELVDGEPIDRWCNGRALTIDARLELFRTVCDAVEYAHERRIVHRDLKPSNVLVRADGTAKLLDFGIAKLATPDGETTGGMTRPGWRLLTPEYASPEQIRGDPVGPESDVYSLGVMLYELLCGRRPVSGSRNVSGGSEDSSPRRAPLPPSALAGSDRVHGELDAIVLKALSYAPDQRHPSAGALARDIRHLLGRVPGRVQPMRRARVVATAGGVVALGVVAILMFRSRPAPAPGTRAAPVLAVGFIADHRAASTASASPVGDLLATNLARVPSLRVVSTARMIELMARADASTHPDAGTYSNAARRAGASMLVDGSLYTVGDTVRLDLRRIDVASGEVLSVHSVSSRDVFTVVDSGTSRLARGMGSAASLGSVADVTTHSEAAYRFYQEGLRAHYRGDQPTARGLFEAALREDSTLAMASYYLARTDLTTLGYKAMGRALAMSARASERERLIIRSAYALLTFDPTAIATAESLLVKYPQELDGPLFAARAFLGSGEVAAALPLLRRVVVADSLAGPGAPACVGCDARAQLIEALTRMDSLSSAEREALVWTRFEPDRAAAWLNLSRIQGMLAKTEPAFAAYNRAARIDATLNGQPGFFARTFLAVDDYDRVDRQLREIARSGAPDRAVDASWYLTLSLRQQGRLREALDAAGVYRTEAGRQLLTLPRLSFERHRAQVLFELGRFVESAALFDTIARAPIDVSPSLAASDRAWSLALGANALLALGDTARLVARIDTVQALGTGSLNIRDRALHHHLRGLAFVARRNDEAAVGEFRLALTAPTGYTRTQYEMARALLRLGRAREAVAAIQPAVRTSVEGAQLYVSPTDRRALLAEAWDAAGTRDSALAHYRIVLRAWGHADPSFGSRVAAIRARVRALEGVRQGGATR